MRLAQSPAGSCCGCLIVFITIERNEGRDVSSRSKSFRKEVKERGRRKEFQRTAL
jgi:hypothetical protein